MEGSHLVGSPRATYLQRRATRPVRCVCCRCGAHRSVHVTGPSGICSVCKSTDLVPLEKSLQLPPAA